MGDGGFENSLTFTTKVISAMIMMLNVEEDEERKI